MRSAVLHTRKQSLTKTQSEVKLSEIYLPRVKLTKAHRKSQVTKSTNTLGGPGLVQYLLKCLASKAKENDNPDHAYCFPIITSYENGNSATSNDGIAKNRKLSVASYNVNHDESMTAYQEYNNPGCAKTRNYRKASVFTTKKNSMNGKLPKEPTRKNTKPFTSFVLNGSFIESKNKPSSSSYNTSNNTLKKHLNAS